MTARTTAESRCECFQAYDIRGRVSGELDQDLARRNGTPLVDRLRAGLLVLRRDSRLTNPESQLAAATGLPAHNRKRINMGLCGTEEVYLGAAHLCSTGDFIVTANHNPAGYNYKKLMGAASERV